MQAPHWAIPQPNLVPVKPRLSRSTQSTGVSGNTSTEWDCPFTLMRNSSIPVFSLTPSTRPSGKRPSGIVATVPRILTPVVYCRLEDPPCSGPAHEIRKHAFEAVHATVINIATVAKGERAAQGRIVPARVLRSPFEWLWQGHDRG